MRALVVYESLWGNTERIARAVAVALEQHANVDVFSAETAPDSAAGYDLVVVGAPTHAMSLPRSTTREMARDQKGVPHIPERGVREWLDSVEPVSGGVRGAAFDTRTDSPRIPGSAAKVARRELRSLGFDVQARPETFRVEGYDGPLVSGEEERAAEWAATLIPARPTDDRVGAGDAEHVP